MSQTLAFVYAVSKHCDQGVFPASKIEFGSCTTEKKKTFRYVAGIHGKTVAWGLSLKATYC